MEHFYLCEGRNLDTVQLLFYTTVYKCTYCCVHLHLPCLMRSLTFFFVSSWWPERINQTVEIIKHTVDIEEKGVKLKLTIVDTPGFGDAVNNNEWWVGIASVCGSRNCECANVCVLNRV